MKNEYTYVASNLITNKQDDTTLIDSLSAEPLSSDVKNNEDLPPPWRTLPQRKKKIKQRLQFDSIKDDQSCKLHTGKRTPLRQTIMAILISFSEYINKWSLCQRNIY